MQDGRFFLLLSSSTAFFGVKTPWRYVGYKNKFDMGLKSFFSFLFSNSFSGSLSFSPSLVFNFLVWQMFEVFHPAWRSSFVLFWFWFHLFFALLNIEDTVCYLNLMHWHIFFYCHFFSSTPFSLPDILLPSILSITSSSMTLERVKKSFYYSNIFSSTAFLSSSTLISEASFPLATTSFHSNPSASPYIQMSTTLPFSWESQKSFSSFLSSWIDNVYKSMKGRLLTSSFHFSCN